MGAVPRKTIVYGLFSRFFFHVGTNSRNLSKYLRYTLSKPDLDSLYPLYKIHNIVQSNTTIINILFIGLVRHVSIPLESSSGPSTEIYRAFT